MFFMFSKLQDLVAIDSGYSFRGAIEDSLNGHCCVLQASNIKQGLVGGLLAQVDLPKLNDRHIVRGGDIVLSNRGNFKAGLIDNDGLAYAVAAKHDLPAIIASSLFRLRVLDSSGLLPDYLVLWFNSSLGQQSLEGLSLGAAIKNITKSALKDLSIHVPSLAKQQQVVAIYRNSQQRQQLYKRQLELQQQIADAAIKQLILS